MTAFDNAAVMAIAKRQSAIDLGCAPADGPDHRSGHGRGPGRRHGIPAYSYRNTGVFPHSRHELNFFAPAAVRILNSTHKALNSCHRPSLHC